MSTLSILSSSTAKDILYSDTMSICVALFVIITSSIMFYLYNRYDERLNHGMGRREIWSNYISSQKDESYSEMFKEYANHKEEFIINSRGKKLFTQVLSPKNVKPRGIVW
jgi:hypothetical protein